MILAVAIGNFTTTFALFDENGTLAVRVAVATDPRSTVDQYALQLFSIFRLHDIERERISGGIISSVVPAATNPLVEAVTQLTGRRPLVVGPGIRTGLNIRADLHTELGADIVTYCTEAVAKYPSSSIVVDFGTAITFSYLRGNTYDGCVIAPGVRISLDALSQQAAALPQVSLGSPTALLGHNTAEAMCSGVVYGSAALVDGILDRMEETIQPVENILATGDYAMTIIPFCRKRLIFEPDLLLNGLIRLYQKNVE